MANNYTFKQHEWHAGQLIQAGELNNIQDGIQEIIDNFPEIVKVSNSAPPSLESNDRNYYNQIWIKGNNGERRNYEIPTLEEFNNLKNSIALEYNKEKQYNIGDYAIYKNKVYKCIQQTQKNQEWNSSHWSAETNLTEDLLNYFNNNKNIVLVQEQQPNLEDNKIWISTAGQQNEIEIPTYEEFNELSNEFRTYFCQRTANLIDMNDINKWYIPENSNNKVRISIPEKNTIRVTSNIPQTYAVFRTDIDVSKINTLYISFSSIYFSNSQDLKPARLRLCTKSGAQIVSIGDFRNPGGLRKSVDVSNYNDIICVEIAASVDIPLVGYTDYKEILVTTDSNQIEYVPYYTYQPQATDIKKNFNTFKNNTEEILQNLNDFKNSTEQSLQNFNTFKNNVIKDLPFFKDVTYSLATLQARKTAGWINIITGGHCQQLFANKNTGLIIAPEGANYLYISLRNSNFDYYPNKCIVNGYDYTKDSITNIKSLLSQEKYKLGIPSYYDSQIQTVLAEVQGNNLKSIHGDSLIMITDPHLDGQNNISSNKPTPFYNAGYTLSIAKYISDHTNNKTLILGGDVLTYGHTKERAACLLRDYYNRAYSLFGSNYRPLCGNHDDNIIGNNNNSERYLSKEEIYSLVFKSMENYVPDKIKKEGTELYYYWDNFTQKIRYLALDFGRNGWYSAQQLTWICDTISNLEQGWSIIVFTHGIYNSDNNLLGCSIDLLELLAAYNARSSVTLTNRYLVEVDFTKGNAKGYVKIVIGGHAHKWKYEKYQLKNENQQVIGSIPVVMLNKDGIGNSQYLGKIEETYFTMIDFDLDNNDAYFTEFRKVEDNISENEYNRSNLTGIVKMATIQTGN